MSQTHPLTTTTFDLPGYRVTKSFGVVRGIIVRSRSVIGNIGASVQAIFGGNISLYTNLCERTREDAAKAIPAGTIIELIGRVAHVGNTSLKVAVEVFVEEMYTDSRERAIHGTFTFVAIDDNKKPVTIRGVEVSGGL